MFKSTIKPGLVKAHIRVVLARVELKKALVEYNALKIAPLPDESEAVAVTAPAASYQAGALSLCLFPQPRFDRIPYRVGTGTNPLNGGCELREGFETEWPIDADFALPSGGVRTVSTDRSEAYGYATQATFRG